MSNENRKLLKVGDRVRIIEIPEYDRLQFEQFGNDFTYRVLRRLIEKKVVRKIYEIDEWGNPWIAYQFRNDEGKMEYHTLSIYDDSTWVKVRNRG